mmetsp:Transcript_90539/g.281510  ORF Transcript_90539/g.281510 Transcript_90539/m.281510 type:complete len:202 (+) Transcript_90539:66-671(+)
MGTVPTTPRQPWRRHKCPRRPPRHLRLRTATATRGAKRQRRSRPAKAGRPPSPAALPSPPGPPPGLRELRRGVPGRPRNPPPRRGQQCCQPQRPPATACGRWPWGCRRASLGRSSTSRPPPRRWKCRWPPPQASDQHKASGRSTGAATPAPWWPAPSSQGGHEGLQRRPQMPQGRPRSPSLALCLWQAEIRHPSQYPRQDL